MTNEKNNTQEQGADLNLVASDDSYALNAPYAKYEGAYTVLAHGPSKKGEMFVSSRQEAKDAMDAQYTPHDLAGIIKADPHYHEGQPVALFVCNAGKWGEHSYAQALSNEMGTKVIAPTEIITAVTFEEANDYHFKEWVIAKNVSDINPSKPAFSIMGNPMFDSVDKVVADPDGKLKYLRIDTPGTFSTFSPENEKKVDSHQHIENIHGSSNTKELAANNQSNINQLSDPYKLALVASQIATLPESQRAAMYAQVAANANDNGIFIEEMQPNRQPQARDA